MAIRSEVIFENLVKEVLERELSLKLESDVVVEKGASKSRFDLADLYANYFIEVKHRFNPSNRGSVLQSVRGRFSAAFEQSSRQHFLLVFGVELSNEDKDYFQSSYKTIGKDTFRLLDFKDVLELANKHGLDTAVLTGKKEQIERESIEPDDLAEVIADVVDDSIKNFTELNSRIFVGGHTWEDESKLDQFISEKRWENGNEGRNVRAVNSANIGDVVLMKSTYVQDNTSFLRIKAIGIVTENKNDGHNLDMQWTQLGDYINVPGLGKLRNTFQLLREKDYGVLFRELINRNPILVDEIIRYVLQVKRTNYNSDKAGGSKRYWWFRNIDDEWNVRNDHLNERRFYSLFSENIGQRQKPENFDSLAHDDYMLAFQKGNVSEVVSILRITDEKSGRADPKIGYETISKLDNSIPWENIRTLDSLQDTEVLTTTHNLVEITEEQFLDILSIVSFDFNNINLLDEDDSNENATTITNIEFESDLIYVKIPFNVLTPNLLDSSFTGTNESSIIHNIKGDHQIFLAFEKTEDVPDELEAFPFYKKSDPDKARHIEDTIIPGELDDPEELNNIINTLRERQDKVSELIDKWNLDATQEIEFVNTPISFVDGEVPAVLGVEELAKDIHGLIKQIKGMEKGVMFGIFGKWGRGKTFLWDRIAKEIQNDPDGSFLITTFHAWKYQDTPASWAYLYETLADNYYGKSKHKNWFKKQPFHLTKFCRKIWLNLIRLGPKSIIIFVISFSISLIWYFAVPISFKLKLILSLISTFTLYLIIIYRSFKARALELFKKYTRKVSFSEFLGIQAEIQRELKFLLKAWLGSKDRRVLVFVDDIDRCREDKIIEIIDSLRVMLEEPDIHDRVVVIAAIDESILKMAIRSKYHHLVKEMHINGDKDVQEKTLASMTNEYMDKLFLAGIKLPSLTTQNKRDVLNAITKDRVGKVESKHKKVDQNPKKQNTTKSSEPDKLTLLRRELNLLRVFSQGLFASQRPSPVTSKIVEEEGYEILESDKDNLENSLNFYETATPRQIRILVYRYLLARKLLQRKLLAKDLLKEWDNQFIGEILPLLILKTTILKSNGDKEKLDELDFELARYDLEQQIEAEIDEILKLVVAY